MRKLIAIVAVMLMGVAVAGAASRKAVRINEVMVTNETSIVDEYGNRSGWVELFNSNFAPIDISSIYLGYGTDSASMKKHLYPVPLGDVNTRIARRQHVVFFTDGQPNKGTFHTNFVLEPGLTQWVGIFDADSSLIDCVEIPATLLSDQSFAREEDGTGRFLPRTGSDEHGQYITPSSANIIRDTNERIALFANRDKNGFAMTLMAMGIVFTALLVLCLCFYGIGKIGAAVSRMNKARVKAETGDTVVLEDVEHDSGEAIAAIVMALHEHLNAHDTENTVLTINKVKRAYSPWSSKIYGLRQVPEHHSAR